MASHTCSRILQSVMCQKPTFLCMFRSAACLQQNMQQHKRSSVDERDIDHFSKLSSGWWDQQGHLKILHALNKLRVPLIRDGLFNAGRIESSSFQSPEPLYGVKILEVGCGGGILTEPLARLGADVTGIDASQSMIDVASSHAQQDRSVTHSITYICRTVEEHAMFHRDCYDAVVASEVLEHVADKDLFLQACVSTVKPGGSVFITTLNRTTVVWVCGIVLAEYILRVIPPGTHELHKCMKPHETQALLEKCRCTTKLIHGMIYNLLLNEWTWTSNTSMFYALHAVRKPQ